MGLGPRRAAGLQGLVDLAGEQIGFQVEQALDLGGVPVAPFLQPGQQGGQFRVCRAAVEDGGLVQQVRRVAGLLAQQFLHQGLGLRGLAQVDPGVGDPVHIGRVLPGLALGDLHQAQGFPGFAPGVEAADLGQVVVEAGPLLQVLHGRGAGLKGDAGEGGQGGFRVVFAVQVKGLGIGQGIGRGQAVRCLLRGGLHQAPAELGQVQAAVEPGQVVAYPGVAGREQQGVFQAFQGAAGAAGGEVGVGFVAQQAGFEVGVAFLCAGWEQGPLPCQQGQGFGLAVGAHQQAGEAAHGAGLGRVVCQDLAITLFCGLGLAGFELHGGQGGAGFRVPGVEGQGGPHRGFRCGQLAGFELIFGLAQQAPEARRGGQLHPALTFRVLAGCFLEPFPGGCVLAPAQLYQPQAAQHFRVLGAPGQGQAQVGFGLLQVGLVPVQFLQGPQPGLVGRVGELAQVGGMGELGVAQPPGHGAFFGGEGQVGLQVRNGAAIFGQAVEQAAPGIEQLLARCVALAGQAGVGLQGPEAVHRGVAHDLGQGQFVADVPGVALAQAFEPLAGFGLAFRGLGQNPVVLQGQVAGGRAVREEAAQFGQGGFVLAARASRRIWARASPSRVWRRSSRARSRVSRAWGWCCRSRCSRASARAGWPERSSSSPSMSRASAESGRASRYFRASAGPGRRAACRPTCGRPGAGCRLPGRWGRPRPGWRAGPGRVR